MSMNAVMIDMEFLDTKPSAAILSVGMVAMDTDNLKMGETFGFNFDVADCMRHGMTASAETIAWWVKQDQKTIIQAFEGDGYDHKHSLELGLVKISNFVSSVASVDNIDIWQQGSLDANILQYGYDKMGKVTPWHFWNVNDLRTLMKQFPQISVSRVGTKHNALDDAKNQVNQLFAILKHIRGVKEPKVVAEVPVDDEL